MSNKNLLIARRSVRVFVLGAVALGVWLLMSLLLQSCSVFRPEPTATPTKTLQPTFTPVTPVTATPLPSVTPTPRVRLEISVFLPEGSTPLSSQDMDLDDDGEMETIAAYLNPSGLGKVVVLDELTHGKQLYFVGNDPELFMFKNENYDIRVGDVNSDGHTDIVVDGPMGDQGHFLHIAQWNGQGYPIIARFFAETEVTLQDMDDDGVSEVVVKSVPHARSGLVSTKVYKARDTNYELIIDSLDFASGAAGALQFPEQTILHYYQLLQRGEFEAAYSMLSVAAQERVPYGDWGALMDRFQKSSVSNVAVTAEEEGQAIVAVDIYVHNPTTGEWEPRVHTWQLLKVEGIWQLNDSTTLEMPPTPTVTSAIPPTETPIPTDTPRPATPTAPPTNTSAAETAPPPPTHTPVPAATPAPPLEGGSWDMEEGFYEWHSPYEGFMGHVANGWNTFIKAPDAIAAPRFNENKFNLNIHSGQRSQEISFDWRTGEIGMFRTIETAPGHNYTVEAWAKFATTESGYELYLGIDLTGGENFEAETVTWYSWDDMTPDTWVKTSETVRATGERMTIFLRAVHHMAAEGGHKPGGNTMFDNVKVIDNGP